MQPRGSLSGLMITAAFFVELDVVAVDVGVPDCAHHDACDDIPPLNVAARNGVLHGGDDDVTDAGVASRRTALAPDAQDFLMRRCCRRPSAAIPAESLDPLTWLTCTVEEPQTIPDVRGLCRRRARGGRPSKAYARRPRPLTATLSLGDDPPAQNFNVSPPHQADQPMSTWIPDWRGSAHDAEISA